MQNFEAEKLAHKICAKKAKNHAKISKIVKISTQKMQKPYKKCVVKQKISTAVKN